MILLYLPWAQWKNMDNKELILSLQKELPIPLANEGSIAQLRNTISDYINELLEKNFERLVSLLYRLDVNENKLRQLLKDNKQEDAGLLIADLIIERQLEKINTRKQFKSSSGDINEDEKW